MEISRELIPILGSVLAASIAGAVAFLASVFTKEAKTSEFRQGWIEGLRSDMAELASLYRHIAGSVKLSAQAGIITEDFMQSLKREFLQIELMHARIELRLNPVEHKDLIELLKRTVVFDGISDDDVYAHTRAVEKLINSTQAVLKEEWKRVKRGERVYWISKWTSLLLFVSTLIVGVSVIMGLVNVSVAP